MRRYAFLLAMICGTAAFDVSWIPAGDAPLPLSAKYRQKLARLCELDSKGDTLSKQLSSADLSRVRRSCVKLSRDTGVGGGDYGALLHGSGPSPLGLGLFVLVLTAVFGGPALKRLQRGGAQLGSRGGATGPATAAPEPRRELTADQKEKLAAMREARLARLGGLAKES